MASQSNGNDRIFQDDTRYKLPKDTLEHERLDAQSASLVALMNDRPFHAPLSNPRKILDIGCGTGYMTHLLGLKYPNAQVFGVDIAPVPESRHGRLENVQYVQGDILELIGADPRFETGSFDYIFQRLLIFGIKGWPEYISSVSTLLKLGGWIEAQEVSMQIYSSKGEVIGDGMPWYVAFKQDAAVTGMDVEIGTSLHGVFGSIIALDNVQEAKYKFAPTVTEDARLDALQGQVPDLFSVVVRKICGSQRGEEDGENLVTEMRSRWERGFNKGDHFPLHAVIGQKKET